MKFVDEDSIYSPLPASNPNKLKPPTPVPKTSKTLNLWIHNANTKQDFILNPDFFPGIKLGQLLEIYNANEESDVTEHLIVKVDSLDKENIGKENRPILQISVSDDIATKFQFKNKTNVLVREVDAERVAADYVEYTFKDQYIGRSDMWRLSRSLIDTCVYVGQRVEFAGCIKAQVRKIFTNGEHRKCGYVTNNSKPIFRSESAKLFLLVQMSKEMWEFDEDGELFYEKAVDGFFTELFQRWKNLGTNHVVSIVLFSRVFYEDEEVLTHRLLNDESIVKAGRRYFKDFYKVIVDWETRNDWNPVLKLLKEELTQYQTKILLREVEGSNDEKYEKLLGKNSYAFEGNILEAISLALNPFDRHYVDRDLLRTGLSIIIVTPGCCKFEVDKKLLRITAERMIDNGIGLDLVSLSRIPLHAVPLFIFNSQELTKAPFPDWWITNVVRFGSKFSSHSKEDSKLELRDPLDYDDYPNSDTIPYYKTPDWIDCSFYSRHQDKPFKHGKFNVRCTMYEIQMMGIMEHEISDINIPFLENGKLQLSSPDDEIFDNYDDDVFAPPEQNELPLRQQKIHEVIPDPPLFPPDTRQGPIFKNQFAADPLMDNMMRQRPFQPTSDSIQDDEEEDSNTITTSTVSPISIKQSNNQQPRNRVPIKSPGKEESFDDSYGSNKYLSRSNYNSMNSLPLQIPSSLPSNIPPNYRLPNYRPPLVNPWNPLKSHNRYGMSTHLRRWGNVFPRQLSLNSMKWPALCTPACLPLTTDYLPPINEPGAYDEHNYTISIDHEAFIEHNVTEEDKTNILLKEMISQRLAQGYQLISLNENKPDDSDDSDDSKTTYLSMGRHVHKLTYNLLEKKVDVKRYVRKIQYQANQVSYKCSIWPRCQETYELRIVNFTYPHIDYNWNYVDGLICGYEHELFESLKLWKTRFILIPMENIPINLLRHGDEDFTEEEVRLNGIYRFLELFDKALWVPPNEKIERRENQKSLLRPTTEDLSAFVVSPEGSHSRNNIQTTDEKLTKDLRLDKIFQAMVNNESGIIKDLRWHLKSYQNSIIGNEFVDWLMSRFSDIETRAEAAAFGNELLEKGLYEHCTRRHRFLDGYYFYQIKEEFATKKKGGGWLFTRAPRNIDKIDKPDKLDKLDKSDKSDKPDKPDKPGKIEEKPSELTKAIFIDVDPSKKSDRRETATLHYDVIYNVETCYHFQLNWLGCTARLIEELLQQWNRNADKFGLKLIEAPIEQAMSLTDNNPFQSPTLIKLSVLPPSLERLEKLGKKLNPEISSNLYFETQLVKYFKFMLDVEADDKFPKDAKITYSYHKTPYKYSQYIHKSGVAFIQICDPGKGFLWVNNRIYYTTVSNRRDVPNPDELLIEFQDFCNDEVALSKFWDDVIINIKSQDIFEHHFADPYNINW